jgi:hypothetical protein
MSDDDGHVPTFYANGKFTCDCWFQLWDIRRLVANDTLGVVEELKKLRNTRYNDRPVSIYGGMVDLPLIVTRGDAARYFDPAVRAALTGGRFWCEFDAERSGVGAIEKELRENLFGVDAWSGLDPAARSFVASAEKVFRDHRADPAFDFSGVVVDFAKAFEVQVNGLLRRAFVGAPGEVRHVNVDGDPVAGAARRSGVRREPGRAWEGASVGRRARTAQGSKGATCRTAPNSILRQMPDCAKCRRAPNAKERRMPNGAPTTAYGARLE